MSDLVFYAVMAACWLVVWRLDASHVRHLRAELADRDVEIERLRLVDEDERSLS